MIENGMWIADRYEVERKIGTGGMSDVYKAMDHTLGRSVAIKVLKQEFCEDMTFVSKFRTEAQSAAGLEHPNIVNIYDVGSQDGFYYIIMEYVEGITLKNYIERKGQLNYKETLSIAIQVSRGIQAAHAKNIIHRDIKPQNIIISKEGKVKVTDFGIARAISENTIHSDVMGSVHYLSPEQARNGYVSNRSDIYSIGIVMYEMVTGQVPYDGESAVSIAIKHLQDEMVPPHEYAKDVPVSLEKIILKCTQKSADRRYDSIESLLVDLRKSLLTPNEDFVTLVPFNQDKTRVLSAEEVKEIQDKTGTVDVDDRKSELPVSDKRDRYARRNKYEDEYDEDEYDEDARERYYDDDDEDERFLNSRLEKVVNVLRIVVAIIIALIVIYLVGSFLGVFNFGFLNRDKKNDQDTQVEQASEKVEMIDLTDMTLDEANAALEDLGLTLKSTEEHSDDVEKGKIMDQDVKLGDMVDVGTTVHVLVSSGPEEVEAADIEVPDVIGDTAEAAMATLQDRGLSPIREFEYDSSVEAGKVIRQSPSAGSTAKEGDKVTIYVSQGTESAKVPNVEGKSQSDAESALGDAGLNVGNITEDFSDSVAEGLVIDQSVEAGKYVDKGTSVNLILSKGKKEISYYLKSKVTAPSNVTVLSADISLYKAESDALVQSWDSVTEFPATVEAHGITGTNKGTLVIVWHYTDADGNEGDYEQSADVTFYEE